MENGKIQPCADPKPLNRPQDDPLCKISCKSVYWGLLGKWVKC